MLKSRKDFLPLLAAILIFVVLGPYFVWGLMKNNFFVAGVNAVLALIFLKGNVIKKNIYLFLLILAVSILYSVNSGVSILGYINISFSLFVAFGNDEITKKTFNYFVNIYAAIILLSSIVWIGVLMGVVSPIGTIAASNEFKSYDYTIYPLTVYANRLMFYRFCGPFDEPGVVGTTSAILLFILGFKAKDWKTYALILSGALSLSLFFFMEVFLFFVVKNATSLRLRHLLIFALFVGLLYGLTKDNEIISERLWERVEWNEEEGTIAGDNRMVGDANEYFKKKRWTTEYWFGLKDVKSSNQFFEGSSSYKVIILKCGMICFSLYVAFFLLYARKYCKRTKFFLFATLFLTTIFQRPWMFGIGYFFWFPLYARFNLDVEDKSSKRVVKN